LEEEDTNNGVDEDKDNSENGMGDGAEDDALVEEHMR